MTIKTRGIIIRTVKYGETSLIVDVLTEAKGLRTYIVSGVRQSKSKIGAALLQVPSLVALEAYERENVNIQKINRLREIKLAYVFQKIPFDIQRGAIALFMAEVVRRIVREDGMGEEHASMFVFIFEAFRFLDTTTQSFANLHLGFLVMLSHFLGFYPLQNAKNPPITEGVINDEIFDMKEGIFRNDAIGHRDFIDAHQSKLFKLLLQTNFFDIHTLHFSRVERQTLLKNLLTFFSLHIEQMGKMNTHLILQEIF